MAVLAYSSNVHSSTDSISTSSTNSACSIRPFANRTMVSRMTTCDEQQHQLHAASAWSCCAAAACPQAGSTKAAAQLLYIFYGAAATTAVAGPAVTACRWPCLMAARPSPLLLVLNHQLPTSPCMQAVGNRGMHAPVLPSQQCEQSQCMLGTAGDKAERHSLFRAGRIPALMHPRSQLVNRPPADASTPLTKGHRHGSIR